MLASRLVLLALIAPGIMMADLCRPNEVCTYSITGTGLNTSAAPPTEDTSTTWNLTFQFLGPEMINAAPDTLLGFTVTGAPAAGWTYDAANSGLSSYDSVDGDAFVTFDDPDSATDGLGVASVTYTFFATDQFWATAGTNIAFGARNDSSAASGAFFTLNSDPPCTACTVSISATPAAVPEPASGVLLGTVGGIALYFLRKRKK